MSERKAESEERKARHQTPITHYQQPMSKPVITVENLSKAYRIGLKEEIPDTLVSAMSGIMKAPFRKFRDLRKLDTFGHSGADEEDIYWALKDVSFEVQEGEVLGVIGRNGAGKSTLLKILSRITEPTSGRAVIRGRVSSLLEVGTGFHPELSGRENVYLNGTILGMTKREIDRKFDEIVDFSGIEKFLDTPIKRYSSGMKVRLAFAVAAHLEPEILIIDEVLAVGDAEFQKKCMGKMQDVAQGGRTVLFVSHNMDAVRQLTDRCVLLNQGKVVDAAPAGQMVDRYIHMFRTQLLPLGNVENSDRRNRELLREVEFVRVDFHDSASVIECGDPMTLNICVRLNSPVLACRISGTVLTEEETPIGSFFSEEFNLRSRTVGTTVSLKVTLSHHGLAPGRYYFGIATGSGNNVVGHRDYDILTSCLPFEVIPHSTGEVLSIWPRSWGRIVFDVPQVEVVG